jgi:hypothetical protein
MRKSEKDGTETETMKGASLMVRYIEILNILSILPDL